MSPPMQLNAHSSIQYVPTSDALERHEYGITKNRKPVASTGGGRAWSEDEEVYLLQTRLQKMPYKHIAAHLKKTELACRLHYHQLSHGSNRRKRTTSVSSGSSSGQSPTLPVIVPSPIRECSSRDSTPPRSAGSYATVSPAASMQLPSILSNPSSSPTLPAILPKPMAMGLPAPMGYPAPVPEQVRTLGPSPFPQPAPVHHAQPPAPVLRLDCSLPPPTTHVDIHRLQSVYAAHRMSFWGAVANDYGPGVSPMALEQAWKSTVAASAAAHAPITPVTSPNEREAPAYDKASTTDRTRISAILGIDADPRSPLEREMVRRLEEERIVSVAANA